MGDGVAKRNYSRTPALIMSTSPKCNGGEDFSDLQLRSSTPFYTNIYRVYTGFPFGWKLRFYKSIQSIIRLFYFETEKATDSTRYVINGPLHLLKEIVFFLFPSKNKQSMH